jgi:hypothetical protein
MAATLIANPEGKTQRPLHTEGSNGLLPVKAVPCPALLSYRHMLGRKVLPRVGIQQKVLCLNAPHPLLTDLVFPSRLRQEA